MRAAAQALADLLPNARADILDGQGHDIVPAVLGPVLTAFLKGGNHHHYDEDLEAEAIDQTHASSMTSPLPCAYGYRNWRRSSAPSHHIGSASIGASVHRQSSGHRGYRVASPTQSPSERWLNAALGEARMRPALKQSVTLRAPRCRRRHLPSNIDQTAGRE
jgi:hypothetical protein